jgi:rRNA maturation protein Rpf1
MDDEFKRTGVNTAVSSRGFTVEARFAEVAYDDDAGYVEIYAEWGGAPTEVILYKRSLKSMSASRVKTVISNVTRALKYLGHRVDVSSEQ